MTGNRPEELAPSGHWSPGEKQWGGGGGPEAGPQRVGRGRVRAAPGLWARFRTRALG